MPIVAFETIENKYPPDKYKMFVALSYKNINKRVKQFVNAILLVEKFVVLFSNAKEKFGER